MSHKGPITSLFARTREYGLNQCINGTRSLRSRFFPFENIFNHKKMDFCRAVPPSVANFGYLTCLQWSEGPDKSISGLKLPIFTSWDLIMNFKVFSSFSFLKFSFYYLGLKRCCIAWSRSARSAIQIWARSDQNSRSSDHLKDSIWQSFFRQNFPFLLC